jgi:hypothetical protein
MSIDDKLSQVFDVAPMTAQEVLPAIPEVNQTNQALENDFETTRSNLHSLLTQGQDALYHALEVAKQSEHPRAFEVVGGLVKHLSDINGQLLDLHKKKQTIEAPTREETKSVTNNAIFVGSTNELSKMLNDLRKGK